MKIMKEKSKKMIAKKNEYYFGGPVPREIQERLEACRDRGMTVQTIARKLAYLWLALIPEKQNQLYFSLIDEDFDGKDKGISDLLVAVDEVLVGNLLAKLPKSARLAEAFAAALQPMQDQQHKPSRQQPKASSKTG